MNTHHVVILGAGAAGTAAARALAGHDGLTTTLVGRTDETPYMRMLVKQVAFGAMAPGLARLPLPDSGLLPDTAVRVDTGSREISLASGSVISYDSLILATGSRARTLDTDIPGVEAAERAGVLLNLHSLDDAIAVRETVLAHEEPLRVAILGGGLIAAETASALREQGHHVSLIARSHVPGATSFGRPIAERLTAEHRARVDTFFGRSITGIRYENGVSETVLDDGTHITSDLIIVAHGATTTAPAPWQRGADVDDRLNVRDLTGVFAAGGVATHHDDHLGTWRIDHWEDAAAQGTHSARMLLHELDRGEDPGPYLPRGAHLSMIYGLVVAGVGYTAGPEARVEEGGEFLVLHGKEAAVVGVSGIDAVGTVYQWAKQLHGVPV